jgi:hypothetical protein
MLGHRFERQGRMDDLEEAIRTARRVVEVIPKDHEDLAALLHNLGNRLESRFERMGRMEDLEEAIQMALESWKCVNGVSFHRVAAALPFDY